MNTGEFITITAAIVPEREAIVFEDTRLNFGELNDRVNRLANGLMELGIGSGDRVATMEVNTNTMVEIIFACAKIDAVFLPLNFRAKPEVLTLLLVPMMLSPAVMGLYWNLILNGNYGILNQALGVLGVSQPQWLTNPDLKLLSILLIALAGLNTIPAQLYEAAEIDRASRWTVFRRITLPLCAPLLFLLTFPYIDIPTGSVDCPV